MKDFRGTEIVVGAKIVYAVKHSTFVQLTEGTVVAVGETRPAFGSPAPFVEVERKNGGRLVKLGPSANVIVLDTPQPFVVPR